jgi:hypothetical protein
MPALPNRQERAVCKGGTAGGVLGMRRWIGLHDISELRFLHFGAPGATDKQMGPVRSERKDRETGITHMMR